MSGLFDKLRPQNIGQLKEMVDRFGGFLSSENKALVSEIIGEVEKGDGNMDMNKLRQAADKLSHKVQVSGVSPHGLEKLEKLENMEDLEKLELEGSGFYDHEKAPSKNPYSSYDYDYDDYADYDSYDENHENSCDDEYFNRIREQREKNSYFDYHD